MKPDPSNKQILAKAKKLITGNNADGFALAVELLRTLDADEDTWLALLSEEIIKSLIQSKSNRVHNLLLETAGLGNKLTQRVLSIYRYADEECYEGITSLSDVAAATLGKHKGRLSLGRLTSLSATEATGLGKHHGKLFLNRLRHLDEASAAALAKHRGSLLLEGLRKLDNSPGHLLLAVKLAQHKGSLTLDHVTDLSDPIIQALSRHRGSLSLCGLKALGDAGAAALAKHQGSLALNGLSSLSDSAAQSLGTHANGVLRLEGLKTLTDVAAAGLAIHVGNLYLDLSNYPEGAGGKALKAKMEGQRYF